MSFIAKTLPMRCIHCVREAAKDNPEYYSPKAIRDREAVQARKMLENRPDEAQTLIIITASLCPSKKNHCWPALGKLGPRFG